MVKANLELTRLMLVRLSPARSMPKSLNRCGSNRPQTVVFLAVFVLALISGCSSTSDTDRWSPGPAPAGGWTVSTLFQTAVDDGFSGVVLVRHREQVLLDSAAGFADREAGTPNMTDTVMTMGSMTKQYTAALVMALQEGGMLTVQDRLSDHFGDVPADKAAITIHQLLTHTSGFVGNLGRDDEQTGREEFLAMAWSTPLQASPGAGFSYSNSGYSIVTAIIEKVTGQSYEVALRERLLLPANINETGYVLPDWGDRSDAVGYFAGATGFESLTGFTDSWADDGPYWHLRGNGGLLTTTGDLLKWHDALSGTEILSADSIDALYGRYVESGLESSDYGYGWFTNDTPAGPLHWHDGANGFHFSQFLRFVDEDLVVIILSNEDNAVAVRLPWHLARTAAPSLANWRNPFGY